MSVLNNSGLNILVIDDNESICKLLAFLLGQEGFRMETALDGETAHRLLADQAFHILIVDLHLPDMYGDTLISFARERFPAVKTILISSHPDVMERAKACAADLVYVKGDSVITLCEQVVALAATIPR